jgi:tetratricopeptide (TPR) repeat protein
MIEVFRWLQGDAPDEASSRIAQTAAPIMDRYTLPFLWIEDAEAGAAGQYGSGVLLEVAGRHFLVTAAHTLDQVTVIDRPTYFPAAEGEPVLPFGERRCVTTVSDTGLREGDPIDLAVIDIDDIAARLSDQKRFLSLDQLDADPTDLIGGLYAAWGYPADPQCFHLNRPMLIAQCIPRGYVGVQAPHEPKPFSLFHPQHHVAIQISDLSTHPSAIKPGGISGGGIWRLAQNGRAPSDWTPDDVRLVAIEHVWREGARTLTGTRVAHLLRLVAHEWPSLLNDLSRQFPYRDGQFLSWQVIVRSPTRLAMPHPMAAQAEQASGHAILLGLLDDRGEAQALRQRAQVDRWRGRTDEAFSNMGQSLVRYQKLSDIPGQVGVLLDRSELHRIMGQGKKSSDDASAAAAELDSLPPGAETASRVRLRIIRAHLFMADTRREEARRELDAALTIATDGERASALTALAEFHRRGFDLETAHSLVEQAIQLARSRKERATCARALLERAEILCLRGGGRASISEFTEAMKTLNECVALCSAMPDLSALADALYLRGKVRGALGREDAVADWHSAIHVFDKFKDMMSQANVLFGLGRFCAVKGYYEDARRALLEALEIYVSRDAALGRANVQSALGDLACLQSDIPGGIPCFTEAVRLYRRAGEEFGLSQALAQLAAAKAAVGSLAEAKAAAEEALVAARGARNASAEEKARDVLNRISPQGSRRKPNI